MMDNGSETGRMDLAAIFGRTLQEQTSLPSFIVLSYSTSVFGLADVIVVSDSHSVRSRKSATCLSNEHD